VELFERMLGRAFPSGFQSLGGGATLNRAAPPELARALDAIRLLLGELEGLRANAYDEQQRLQAIENEGREGRVSLGRAMEALTADVSKTREEARDMRAQVAPLVAASKAFGPRSLAAHKELVFWEGRSGFTEPHTELAASYRRLADLTDAWIAARRREIEAEAEATRLERTIADVDFQIRSLRESLANLEHKLEEKRHASATKIAEVGQRSAAIENQMLQLASYFCAPLRPRPELGQLFVELEKAAPTPDMDEGPITQNKNAPAQRVG
jgi:predicted  nucleic acid-binding Zn-ribbon protein